MVFCLFLDLLLTNLKIGTHQFQCVTGVSLKAVGDALEELTQNHMNFAPPDDPAITYSITLAHFEQCHLSGDHNCPRNTQNTY